MTLRCTDFLKRKKAYIDEVAAQMRSKFPEASKERRGQFLKAYLKSHPFETSEAAEKACGFCAIAYRVSNKALVVHESTKCNWNHSSTCTCVPTVRAPARRCAKHRW